LVGTNWIESNTWVPAFDGSGNFVWICGPCEGLWAEICRGEEAGVGGLEVGDGSDDTTLQSALGFAKKPSTTFSQEQDVGVK
jgi:hypothetical protein